MDQEKESIKFNTEVLKLFAVLLIADVGGTISLLTDKDVSVGHKANFVSWGILIAIGTSISIIRLQANIRQMIKNIGEV